MGSAARPVLSDCRRVVTPDGMLILNKGTSGGRWFGTLGRMAKAMLVSWFAHQKLRVASLRGRRPGANQAVGQRRETCDRSSMEAFR